MTYLFNKIVDLITSGDILVSEHAYDELIEDDIKIREVIEGTTHGEVVEKYPDYPKGPCILLLQHDSSGAPIHVVWGVPKGYNRPAVLVTAYRPDPDRWDKSFLWRK